ncbi:helix-turn-helix domain-containing protein [Niabella aurantiaca]|uniref:helix-turn-helix domain-containing protein n=1 Tax=Niabella aurantiaca TaxID=379900 RepID=UPI00037656E8|nr:helix-turn-helix domain-containing protein [Niabella aurantiaca]
MTVQSIYKRAADAAGVPFDDVNSTTRRGDAPLARQVSHYYLYKYYGLNKSELSRMFNVDHTTVIHGIRRVSELVQTGDAKAMEILGRFSDIDISAIDRAYKVVYHINNLFEIYDRHKNKIKELSSGPMTLAKFRSICGNASRFFITNGDEIEIQLNKVDFIKLFTVVS